MTNALLITKGKGDFVVSIPCDPEKIQDLKSFFEGRSATVAVSKYTEITQVMFPAVEEAASETSLLLDGVEFFFTRVDIEVAQKAEADAQAKADEKRWEIYIVAADRTATKFTNGGYHQIFPYLTALNGGMGLEDNQIAAVMHRIQCADDVTQMTLDGSTVYIGSMNLLDLAVEGIRWPKLDRVKAVA